MESTSNHGGNVFALACVKGISPADILDFSASINPLGPPKGVRGAINQALELICHYPDSECSGLRQSLAAHHGVQPANICVANGSTELIYLLPHIAGGKRALVIAPSFSEYVRALDRGGCDVEYLVLNSSTAFPMSIEEIGERLGKGFDLCIIGNPGNPSGRLYPLSVIMAILTLCRAAGTLLVVDEAFMDFCEWESAKVVAAGNEGLIVLRSMTKFYALPGLRLGYAIASEATIGELAAMREPWSVNTLAQAAGIASLADKGYIEETIALIEREREHLLLLLSALADFRPFPSAANYVLVEIVAGPTAAELAKWLAEEQILIRDCSNFVGLDGRFFRMAVRFRQENERLVSLLSSCLRGTGMQLLAPPR